MTDEQILKKAIEKAIEGGFKVDYNAIIIKSRQMGMTIGTKFAFDIIIFSHDFAKAFWGEKKLLWKIDNCDNRICLHCGGKIEIRNPSGYCDHLYYPQNCNICSAKFFDWKYHLQQMVLEQEPLKYLERFI